MKDTELWVLEYEHEYGSDVSVYESYDEARLSAIDIVLTWVHELDEQSQFEVLKFILEKQYDKAIEMYEEYRYGERLIISKRNLHGDGQFDEEKLVEIAKEKFKKLKEEEIGMDIKEENEGDV